MKTNANVAEKFHPNRELLPGMGVNTPQGSPGQPLASMAQEFGWSGDVTITACC